MVVRWTILLITTIVATSLLESVTGDVFSSSRTATTQKSRRSIDRISDVLKITKPQQHIILKSSILNKRLQGNIINYEPIIDLNFDRSITLFNIPRGGGGRNDNIEMPNDNDSNFILQKLQNIVRSILKSTKKSPLLHSTFSSIVNVIETIIGIQLMPKISTNKTKSKKKSSKKKKELKPEAVEKADIIPTKTTKSTKKAKTNTKSKSTKVSSATSIQVNKDLKATNPNYRIQQELKAFILDPPKYLTVKTGKNIRIWIVTMEGIGIYEGETFRLRIQFPQQYPTVPPSVYFLPPNIPIHEHVYTNGDICLSLLGKDWRPTMTAQSIAHSILSILTSATSKTLPMDNARHAGNQPGLYQENWVYHDDNC